MSNLIPPHIPPASSLPVLVEKPSPRLIASPDGIVVDIEDLSDEAKRFIEQSIPENTKRAIENDWKSFHTFCKEHRYETLPTSPEAIIEYITQMSSTSKSSTIERRLATIGRVHRLMGHTSPCQHPAVKAVWKGIRQTNGVKKEGKAPLLLEHVKLILQGMPKQQICDIRNRALLLIGFSAGLRRSELCSMTREQVKITEDGLVVELGRTKTDQEGKGRAIAIPKNNNPSYCAVDAFKSFLVSRGDAPGPLWLRSYKNRHFQGEPITEFWLSKLVKAWVGKIGLDADQYSGHSLRVGLVTSLAMAGVDLFEIQRFVGHGKVETTLRYVRIAEMFTNNPHTKLRW